MLKFKNYLTQMHKYQSSKGKWLLKESKLTHWERNYTTNKKLYGGENERFVQLTSLFVCCGHCEILGGRKVPSDFQTVDYLCNTVVLQATIASLMDGGTIAFVVSLQSVCNLQSWSLQNIYSRSMDSLELGRASFSKRSEPSARNRVLNTQYIFFKLEVVLQQTWLLYSFKPQDCMINIKFVLIISIHVQL